MTRTLPHLPSLPQGQALLDVFPIHPPRSLLFSHAGLLILTQLLSYVAAFRLSPPLPLGA